MRGLCHTCFRSGVDVVIIHGEILCEQCASEKNAKN